MAIDLSKVNCFEQPYKYFSVDPIIPSKEQEKYLSWLESKAPWKLIETEFYEQYEFSLLEDDFPEPINRLSSSKTLSHLKEQVERIFETSLSDKIDISVHKLVHGQTILIHNDYIPGQETHRVLIQLNREWRDEYGGNLIIFSGPEPEQLYDIVLPISGSAQGFAISPNSHHAVSTVHGGERYTIVYSFFHKTKK